MSGMDSGNHTMSSSSSPQSPSPDLGQESKPSSAVELELQALFEELSTATSVVNTIKSRINLIAPVSHLPPELLARIFLILRGKQSISIMPRERNPDCPIFEYLGWIVVTQVCSRWRRAAIDCPALWTRVTFDRGSRWADQMLLRSKQAPVKISICQNNCDWDRKAMIHDAKRIAHHIPHTASLTISVTKAASVLDIFSQELLRPAPILRTLSLAYVFGLREHRGDVHIAPAELFANDTPCLREVSLHNVFIPWSSTLFKGLRSLQIWLPSGLRSPSQAGQYAHFVPALTEFIDALDNMPALQVLNVTRALPSFSAANIPLFTMDRKVSLPQLRNLLFGGAILDVALTLSLLAVPSEFNFGLCCTSCDDPTHTTNLFRIVSSHLGTDPIVASGLSLTPSGCEIWGNMAFKSGEPLYFVFEFDPFVNGGDTMQQFFAALPQIEVSKIEVLNISLNSSAWQRALK
ncbi:hypothetical protein EWM64_g7797 [Hericium alpestre]|uniref:F-box domain-containing protein n=1 Tax=Hericium alpestre TaxID=135208 RepID=A0A4Y9ZMY2_9AGAM|nr:hypothetical protein EWM64_g7797 [Hericium alpestre]